MTLKPLSVLLIAPLIVLAACGGSDGDTSVGTTGASPAASTEPPSESTGDAPAATTGDASTESTEAPSESAGDALDPTATYTFADSRIVSSFDPHKATDNYDVRWLAPVYDRLIHAQPEGGIGPGLATEWDFTDELTLELTLREGVTFHDGTVFDAEVVKANLERAMGLEDASPVTQTAVAPIESIEVIDANRVTIRLSEPAYGLLFDLAIQPGFMINPAAFDNSDLETNPAGSGMYELEEFRPGDRATYSRYDGYWDEGAPGAQTFVLVNMANAETRLNAVISGQVDTTFLESRQVNSAEGAGLSVDQVPTLSFFNLYTNTTLGGLDDIRVRQALAYAIDRPALTQIVAGDATVQPFPSTADGYNDDFPAEYYAYDPEKARSLLVEAGYPDGISLEIQVYSRPEDQQLTELLLSQTSAAGITLEPQVVDPGGAKLFVAEGSLPLFLGRFGGRLDPLQTLNTITGPGGGLNPPLGGSSTPEMAALLDQINATPESPERVALLEQANAELVTTALELPLFVRSLAYVSNDCVVGFQPYLSGSDEYRGVGIANGCR